MSFCIGRSAALRPCGLHRQRLLVASLVCGMALARPAAAATTKPEASATLVHKVTLPDAIRLALQHNPDYRSTGYDVKAAEGAVVQASVLPNPGLFVGAMGTAMPGAPLPDQFGLTWTIPIGGKIAAATDAARASLASARSTEEAGKQALVVQVQTAFVSLLLAESQRDFAKEDQSGFHQTLELNELRYKDGKIAFGDLLKLRLQTVATDDEVREAQLAVENARAELAHVVGEHVIASDFEAVGELSAPVPPAKATADGLLEQALAHRPDYAALQAQEKSAQASLVLARRTPIPDLAVLGDYNRPTSGEPTDHGSYDLSLAVSLPVFDRNQGNITQADAAWEKAQLAEESLRTQIRSDLAKSLAEWRAASALVLAYQPGTLDEAKQSLEITRHAYALGTGSLLDFLDAESSYRATQSAYRAALARTALAADNVRLITGEVQP